MLDAATGAVVWTRNAVNDTGAKVPGWGIAGSPLVVNDLVVVAASGSLIAYDLASGKPRWQGPSGGSGYSSPQLVTINGVQQVVLLNSNGAISVSPADGKGCGSTSGKAFRSCSRVWRRTAICCSV